MTNLVRFALALVFGVGLGVLSAIALDAHRRGMARVRRASAAPVRPATRPSWVVPSDTNTLRASLRSWDV